jgi:glucokinase
MATAAILVNGLPGSGKSTLGVKLAALLGCPMLSKDVIKEQLAESTGLAVASQRLGGIAMDTAWALASAIEDGVVIDSFWYHERDRAFAARGVQLSGASHVLEVWCDVPLDVARERYETRDRHGIHETAFGPWEGAEPLGLWPVVRVDTASTVDFDALLPELARVLLG